jgi:hypothetical protein
MPSLSELTTSRLKRILAIMELIETLQGRVNVIAENGEESAARRSGAKHRNGTSRKPAVRKRRKPGPAGKSKLATISGAK